MLAACPPAEASPRDDLRTRRSRLRGGPSMLIACWSVKGGAGTTIVAAALALLSARRTPTVLVDLAGDLPAALGLPEPASPGISGWLAAGPGVPADALGRIELEVTPGVALLPRGEGVLNPARASLLAALLDRSSRPTVIDCGRIGNPADPVRDAVATTLIGAARRSILVIRPCYMALHRARQAPVRPSGVVVVQEPGRVLTTADVQQVVEVPVLAEVVLDPAVARTVDAGMLAGRLPRSLAKALSDAA
jgi:hypothetical protein